jgi:uncharacterized membrane-anchored protein YitT (DUF2179 family)
MYALSWTALLIPAEVVGGGISGLSAALFYATKIPMEYWYLAINTLLILIAIKTMGTNFGIKTVYSIIVITIFLNLQQRFIHQKIISDVFLSTVLGGALAGAGIGIVFTQGGSTGGTDILALLINKYRDISPGKIILYCDIIIISSSFFIFNNLEKLVYGFVNMAVVAYTIDLVLDGAKQSVQIMIFSKKHNEIADAIANRLSRGVTLIDSEGWYSKQPGKVVMTIVRKNEAQDVHRIVKEIDQEAFISQGAVMGVYGKGFEKIK